MSVRPLPLLLAAVSVSALVVWGVMRALGNADTDLSAWASDDLPAARDLREVGEMFGEAEFLVASWPDVAADDPKLTAISERVSEHPSVERVMTSAEFVTAEGEEPLTPPFGRDGRGWFLVELPAGDRDARADVIGAVRSAADRAGVALDGRDRLRISGVAAELHALSEDGVAAPMRMVPLALVVVLLIARVSVGAWAPALLVAALAALASGLTLCLFPLIGVRVDAIHITLPSLALLLTASLSLHWLGYFRAAAGRGEPDPAAAASREALAPSFASVVTTAAGLMALTFGKTPTIQSYGRFGAAVTLLSGAVALGLLPILVRSVGLKARPPRAGRDLWRPLAELTSRRRVAVLLLLFFPSCVLLTGLPRLRTDVRLDNIFPPDHPALVQNRWLSERLGPLSSLDVILELPGRTLADVETVRSVAAAVEATGRPVFSAASVLPPVPDATGFAGLAARKRFLREWSRRGVREELVSGRLLAENPDREGDLYRLAVSIPSLPPPGSPTRFAEAADVLDAARSALPESVPPGAARVVGYTLMFEEIEGQFVEDLSGTFLSGLAAVGVAVLVTLRSARLTLLAMAPNTLPPLVILGLCGWGGTRLDVGSIMTATIALGIAVDDTMHLLFAWRHAVEEAPDRPIETALRRAGPAVVQTSVICAAGLLVLGWADFLPTRRFAFLLTGMLFAAVLADLLLLPALLSTGLGRKKDPGPAGTPPADGPPGDRPAFTNSRASSLPPTSPSRTPLSPGPNPTAGPSGSAG